jgi:hypothetical protein
VILFVSVIVDEEQSFDMLDVSLKLHFMHLSAFWGDRSVLWRVFLACFVGVLWEPCGRTSQQNNVAGLDGSLMFTIFL